MVEVMVLLAAFFERTYARMLWLQDCCIQCLIPTAGHSLTMLWTEIAEHSQTSLVQSLLGLLLLSPGS